MFEEELTDGVVDSKEILAAIELTILSEKNISDVHKILAGIPVPRDGGFRAKWKENFTCRIWIKEALDNLEEAGVFSISSVGDLENEAIRAATGAVRTGTRVFVILEYVF